MQTHPQLQPPSTSGNCFATNRRIGPRRTGGLNSTLISTGSSPKAAICRFHTFCAKYNVWNPFPVSEKLLCSFVAYLTNDGLAPQTCKSYLAAVIYLATVRNIQLSLGLPDPRENNQHSSYSKGYKQGSVKQECSGKDRRT